MALAGERRPGRYVLEADRVLRAGMGGFAQEEQFPPAIRQLSGEHVQRLYAALVNGGLLDPDHPARVPVGSTLGREPLGPGAQRILVSARVSGQRRMVVLDPDAQRSLAGPALSIAKDIAELAWLDTEPPVIIGPPGPASAMPVVK
jgi:hypothetical protein